MAIYSESVYKNSPYQKEKELISEGEEGNPVPSKVGDASPINYVFYIIKENRTYDQVLGDMREGNGDSHSHFIRRTHYAQSSRHSQGICFAR